MVHTTAKRLVRFKELHTRYISTTIFSISRNPAKINQANFFILQNNPKDF